MTVLPISELPEISGVVSLVLGFEEIVGAGCPMVVTTRLETTGVVELPAASVEKTEMGKVPVASAGAEPDAGIAVARLIDHAPVPSTIAV